MLEGDTGRVPDLPPFEEAGDLPVGVHRATLAEVLARFGQGSPERRLAAARLRRVHELARATGRVARFVVFGSFVTEAPAPNDVDVFLLMEDAFDVAALAGESTILFRHATAQAWLGASVFWLRRRAALGGEQAAVEDWQVKRDGTRRGVVEVVPDDQE